MSTHRHITTRIALFLTSLAPTALLAQAGAIVGSVQDSASRPVSGVVLQLDPGARRTSSGGAGTFRFASLPRGTYTLRVVPGRYSAPEQRVEVGDAPLNVAVTVARVATLPGISVVAAEVRFADTLSAVGARMAIAPALLPYAVQSVSRDVIDERQQITIREGVRLLPGVLPGRSATNELVIRGFNDNGGVQNFSAFGSNFAVNGMRNYAAGYESDILLVNAERVEVVKGASGVLYGFNHPGGMINIVTKKPTAIPLRRFAVSGGTWGRARVEGDVSGSLSDDGRLRYRVSGGYFSSPDFRQVMFNRSYVIAPTVSYQPDDQTRVDLEAVFSRTNRTAWYDWGLPARDAAGRQVLDQVNRQYSAHQVGDGTLLASNALFATVERRLSPSVTWRTEASLASNSIDHNGHYPQFSRARPDSLGRVGLQYRLFNGENAGLFATSFLAWSTSPERQVRHRLVLGVDLLNGDTRGRESSASNNTANPANVAPMSIREPVFGVRPTGNYVFTGGYTTNSRTVQSGLYVQDFVDVGDKVKLLAGLRADRFRTNEDIGAPSEENTPVLWNLGATWAVRPRSTVYVSSTSSFQPQIITDPTAGGPFDALKGQQVEVGMKHEADDGRWRAGLGVYRITRRNQLVSANDPNNENLLRQLGETTSDGVETELLGRLAPWLDLQGWYAWNFARVTVGDDPDVVDKRLPNAPEHSGAIWARVSPTSGRWRDLGLSLGLSGVGERFGAFDRNTYDGYVVTDAAVSWRAEQMTVSLNANNLFNRTYLSGIWSDFYSQLGQPRNVMLRVAFGR